MSFSRAIFISDSEIILVSAIFLFLSFSLISELRLSIFFLIDSGLSSSTFIDFKISRNRFFSDFNESNSILIFFSLFSISSYPLKIISSFIICVVPRAIIHASIIAPPLLKSVVDTYPHLKWDGPTIIAWWGLSISILAPKFSSSLR